MAIIRQVCPIVKCGVCVCVNCKGPSADLDSVSGRPTAPSLACAATRAGSKLRLPETTSQASLGDIRFSHAHHGMGPNCTQAISDVCRGGGDEGGFQGQG